MKYVSNFLIFTLLIVCLIGCVPIQQKRVFRHIPWQERQTSLQKNKYWTINGVLSITYDNKKRDTASFEWKQNQDDYVINISGPMNIGGVRVIGTAKEVALCQLRNKCIKARSAEKLMFENFGWRLPVSNIKYWILALLAPIKVDSMKFDDYGHLVALEQQKWKINYLCFQHTKYIDFPTTVELRNGKIFIKIRIKNLTYASTQLVVEEHS